MSEPGTDKCKPSTSKENHNIDITLNQLENVTYLKTHGHTDITKAVPEVEQAKQRIANFVDWLTFDLRRQFTLNPDIWDYDEFEFVLRQLKTNARAMCKYFKKIKHHETVNDGTDENHKKLQLPCGICNKVVAVARGVNFWTELQKHEHFEQMLSELRKKNFPTVGQQTVSLVDKGSDATDGESTDSGNEDSAPLESIPSGSSLKKENCVSSQFPQKACVSLNTRLSLSPQPIEGTKVAFNNAKEEVPLNNIRQPMKKIISEPNIKHVKDLSTHATASNFNMEPPVFLEGFASTRQATASPPLNTFRFDFKVTYDQEVRSKLYPDAIVRNAKKIDRISVPTILKCSPNRTVCLLCGCDILGKKSQSRHAVVNNVMNHCMGQKHFQSSHKPEVVAAVKQFHETFINFEDTCQAHQVFFRPELNSMVKCMLCRVTVNCMDVWNHINGSAHKNYILDIYRKDKSTYYLIELQVKHYGEKFLKKPEVKQPNPVPGKTGAKAAKNEEAPLANQSKAKNEKLPQSQSKVAKKETIGKEGESAATNGTEKGTHNIILSISMPDSENILERLPNRFSNHLPFLEKRDDDVYCTACSFTCIQPTMSGLVRHLYLQRHLNLTKIEIVQYAYFCEICNTRFDTELSWEEHFKTGQNKHDSIAESRKNLVREYECTVCKTIIFGDELSLLRHKATGVRKKERFRKDVKLPENVKRFFHSVDAIKREGVVLSEEANSVIKENVNMQCCQKLEQVLREAFNNCKAYPFGSRCSGLGNWNSDLDVFIDTGDMYKGYNNQDFVSQHNFVRTATKIFNRYKNDFADVLAIPTARTPIIKLYHISTDLDCDLSFKHGLSVENTKFLRFCLQLQPIAQPFILLLKGWSERCKLNDYLTTYALAIMAIFFLQVNGYLLSVKKLRELSPDDPVYIDGWEIINYNLSVEQTRKYIKMYDQDLITLLKDFFLYYATFSYDIFIICPLLGEKFPRKWFTECPKGTMLPPEMHTYVAQLKNEDAECLRVMTPICVQDPFDLSHNLTKAISVNVTSKLKSLCNMTHQHLESIH